jgi:hypothetical protein
VFHLDVAYVVIAITHVASVCFMFKHMFQVFHLDVAEVYRCFVFFKCFRCFVRMLLVFHLDVASVDLDVA